MYVLIDLQYISPAARFLCALGLSSSFLAYKRCHFVHGHALYSVAYLIRIFIFAHAALAVAQIIATGHRCCSVREKI